MNQVRSAIASIERLEQRRLFAAQLSFDIAAGGAGADIGNAIAVDDAQNVYVAGSFTGSASFGSGAGAIRLSSLGKTDAFVAKYSPAGQVLWAAAMGGLKADTASSIALGPDGAVYVAGTFAKFGDFDPGEGVNLLSALGDTDAFVVRLDGATGTLSWAHALGGAGQDTADGVVAGAGGVYVAGSFSRSVDFDPGADSFVLNSAGDLDVYLARFDTAGGLVWAARDGRSRAERTRGLAIDANENLYVCGYQNRGTVELDFDKTRIRVPFVRKFDSTGSRLWATELDIGGLADDTAEGVAVDAQGGVYITGRRRETLFGRSETIAYVAKLDAADGDPIWEHGGQGTGPSVGQGIAASASGEVYITGRYQAGRRRSDGGAFGLTPIRGEDVMFIELTKDGDLVAARSIGGAGRDAGFALTLGPDKTAYLTGQFTKPIDIDPGAAVEFLSPQGPGSKGDVFALGYVL